MKILVTGANGHLGTDLAAEAEIRNSNIAPIGFAMRGAGSDGAAKHETNSKH